MSETNRRSSGLIGALRRMVSSTAEREAEDLRRQAEEEGARQVSTCADRERVFLHGTIWSVTSAASDEPPRLEADFDDGTGQVRLIWMGRRAIAGVRAGATLRVEGRLSCQGSERRMFNPRYELTYVPGAS